MKDSAGNRGSRSSTTATGGNSGAGNVESRKNRNPSSTASKSDLKRSSTAKRQSPAAASTTQDAQDPRHWQNRVGKRYRDKLSTEFESLQAVLAQSGVRGNDDSPTVTDADTPHHDVPSRGQRNSSSSSSQARNINKAKVLDAARERVSELLEERKVLMAQRDALLSEKASGGW